MSEMAPTFEATIGLEVHAELKTRTKMFCDSANDPNATKPNSNICPVCMAHPGTLPVINKQAVHHVLRMGLAVGGTLADYTEFDRKNYFYPDIPKGYQISQYKFPLVSGGALHDVALTRIHLEEDTASSSHEAEEYSLIDFNRAGVPLMELVTEPVIHTASDAVSFARELQLLLRTLDISDANMELGQMRVEANISVSATPGTLGTKVEVKNLNSFRAVERAIDYELKRQAEVLTKGGTVDQETRGWDENKGTTFSQRKKENAHDYRYFPDPDLPSLRISEIPDFETDKLQKSLPELPWARRQRLALYGLNKESLEILTQELLLGNFFDVVLSTLPTTIAQSEYQRAANYLTSDLIGLGGLQKLIPEAFAELITLISENKLSSRGAKDTLKLLNETGETSAKQVAEAYGLMQQSGTETLSPIIDQILTENPTVVAEVKAGKQAAIQFLIGQGMKKTRGAANPEELQKILLEKISQNNS